MSENKRMPQHIAIILDGNGRWAEQRGYSRARGHRVGAESVREITRECAKKHLRQLTLYAFSQENWKRPQREVNFLMKLLKNFLIKERKEIEENNIRLTAIGRLNKLPEVVQKELAISMDISKHNTGMVLCLALNYGGRSEIVDATKQMTRDVISGKISLEDITEESFANYLYMPGMPELDLLIRTGGELRVSNFLLWEISYSELWFTPVCWPDFRKAHLEQALKDYESRERRFGGLQ